MTIIVTKTDGREVEYLTCAETAKLVRKALKAAFPGVKFSVRSDTYSMGASIHVEWTDGPTQAQLEHVTARYEGGRFDGMIDLAYSVESYLTPDGDAVLAYSPGSQGSRGMDPGYQATEVPDGARRVHFGADHIFGRRVLSPEFRAECIAVIEAATHDTYDPEREYAFGHDGRTVRGYGESVVWQVSCGIPADPERR